jgi:hypothetical protein
MRAQVGPVRKFLHEIGLYYVLRECFDNGHGLEDQEEIIFIHIVDVGPPMLPPIVQDILWARRATLIEIKKLASE